MTGRSKNYECKLISARLAGRPNIKWEKDLEEVLRIIKIKNWTKCVQDRDK